jgi:hypothetical protein
MVAQVPIGILFVVTRGGKPFARILPMLSLQAAAWGRRGSKLPAS